MSKGEVKLLRLTSGEEVLAEATLESGVWTVKNPIVIQIAPPAKEGGEPRLFMSPLLASSADDSVPIHESHVLFPCNPSEQLVQEYNRIFSPIVTPNSGIVTPK